MFDDRQMRHLETQVDALRTKQKDSATRKTYDQVFDQAALPTIASLISDGVISTLDYPVSTGKEANVFHATDAAGRAKALKIYRINTATFRNIALYIEGDPRFKRVKRATKPTIFAWAQKEYKNLVRMGDAGVRVPIPERVLDNVVVMEYIGDETQPAPSLGSVVGFTGVRLSRRRHELAGHPEGEARPRRHERVQPPLVAGPHHRDRRGPGGSAGPPSCRGVVSTGRGEHRAVL